MNSTNLRRFNRIGRNAFKVSTKFKQPTNSANSNRVKSVYATLGLDFATPAASAFKQSSYNSSSMLTPPFIANLSTTSKVEKDAENNSSSSSSLEEGSGEDEDAINTKKRIRDRIEDETQSNESELEEKIKELEKEVKESKNKILLGMADAENARKRHRDEIASTRKFAIQKFAKQLLDVSDNLSRALQFVPEEKLQENPDLKNLFQGVDLTRKELIKVFENNKLVEYGTAGDEFDANLHQAVQNIKAEEGDGKTVIDQVYQTGFKLDDRVIRPAQVVTKS